MDGFPRLVGCLHLPPLPGSARGTGAAGMAATLERVRRDATAYAEGGADAIIVENFGDAPFVKDAVLPHTIAAMTLAVQAARECSGLPVGINVLRNDALAAVSIAAMAGSAFVRVNVYVGAAVTDQGLIEGRADEVQTLIRRLEAEVQVWADVDVKHAAPLASRPIEEIAEDAIERGLASAVIVTGAGTGKPATMDDLRRVRTALPAAPIYAGSGVTPANAGEILTLATGTIVGTAAKVDGLVTNPVDPARVRALASACG